MKIKIGILAPSEIAFRRFLPAILKLDMFEYVGVAIASASEWFGSSPINENVLISDLDKANKFVEKYGGIVFHGYENFLKSNLLDAIYVPLPPALHFRWASLALKHNLHVLVEKPSTTSYSQTLELITQAKSRNLAIHENYMFVYHPQISAIKDLISNNKIGDVRLCTINFGFPFRGASDFRYNKELGGGALLDCGGYTLKLATLLLGESAKVVDANLGYKDNMEVDIYGSATIRNNKGHIANIAFGMDNSYKCDLDIWGSTGRIYTNRVFTAPEDFTPIISVIQNGIDMPIQVDTCNSFIKSIEEFYNSIIDKKIRERNYEIIISQSKILDEFMKKVGEK